VSTALFAASKAGDASKSSYSASYLIISICAASIRTYAASFSASISFYVATCFFSIIMLA
jgi:hypothetical protein